MFMNKMAQKIKALIAEIKDAACDYFGYTVWCAEYGAVHYTWKWSEALEWMKCYNQCEEVIVFKGFWSKIVASRKPQ